MLIDWDLAIDVDSKAGAEHAPSALYHTGTGTFMALQLLKFSPHLYRHDLESFFYILIWCACGFLLGGEEVQERGYAGSWASDTWSDIYKSKSTLLYNPSPFDTNKLKAVMTTPFEPLWETWIKPLAELIGKAGAGAGDDLEEGLECDCGTLGGRLTYGKFVRTLGVDFGRAPHNLDLDLLD